MENVNTTAAKPKNVGGRPAKPLSEADLAKLVQRPEVQQLVAAAVAQALASTGHAMAAPAGADGGTPAWAGQLAVALGQVADPRKKPLDPAVIQRRQEARTRMNILIAQAQGSGDVPEYELTRECYLEEQLISATYIGADRVVRRQVIGWPKVPNQAMVPVNECAARIYGAYLESVGGVVTEGKTPDAVRGGHLKVYKDGMLQSIPEARPGRSAGSTGVLSLRGHNQPGQVIETNVLGTVHAPARQTA